jgi:hypothetical protein
MTTTRRKKGFRAIAVLLVFGMAQVYVQLSFAESTASSGPTLLPQQFIARLTTSGGPITVNGTSADTGASLVTGARIQTPAAVSATVDLGPLGSLKLAPDSDVRLDFDENGKVVKVTVFKGCFVLITMPGTEGVVDTERQPRVAETNRAGAGLISGCMGPTGFGPGSGASAIAGTTTPGSAMGAGATLAAILASIAAPTIAYLTHRPGDNPSPSAP